MAERERLELEDFEGEFDAVDWLNTRLNRNSVAFDRLDPYLSSLGMSCQLLCLDTSESIEVASNQLVSQLPSTKRDLEKMRSEVLRGRERLKAVSHPSSINSLAEIDAVKTRVETACSALREVGSWERKVRDCEQMIHSGGLAAGLKQLGALKDVLKAFKMLPEYPKKEEQVKQLEETLLGTARRKTKQVVERNAAHDLPSCCEVFAGLDRHDELGFIVNAVFLDLTEKVWQSQGIRPGSSAPELAGAVKAVFEAVVKALNDRWPLLEALGTGTGGPSNAEGKAPATTASVVLPAVRSTLAYLCSELEPHLTVPDGQDRDERPTHTRAARAFALFAAYTDGFAALSACSAFASPALWREVCCERDSQTIPWSLLREVTTFVVWQPMRDDATALVPQAHGRPSEAVLAAESNAKRLLQMPTAWARRLEQQGAVHLTVPWLACSDETLAGYWRSWDQLIDMFLNTLHKSDGHDASLLNECMQLHSLLHDSVPLQFATFQVEMLQSLARMRAVQGPLGHVLEAKFTDPRWCELLGVPSPDGLRSASLLAHSAVASQALPQSTASLADAEKRVRGIVTQCCTLPVLGHLKAYPESPEFSAEPDVVAAALPLQCVTAVVEHLFALCPQLERPRDSTQLQWLPTILGAVVDIMVQKVLLIKKLSPAGAQQLIVDLEYLQKVIDALSSGCEGTAELKELKELLDTLGPLLGREGCESSSVNRRFDRILRAALAAER